jgi:hypothetical protein
LRSIWWITTRGSIRHYCDGLTLLLTPVEVFNREDLDSSTLSCFTQGFLIVFKLFPRPLFPYVPLSLLSALFHSALLRTSDSLEELTWINQPRGNMIRVRWSLVLVSKFSLEDSSSYCYSLRSPPSVVHAHSWLALPVSATVSTAIIVHSGLLLGTSDPPVICAKSPYNRAIEGRRHSS